MAGITRVFLQNRGFLFRQWRGISILLRRGKEGREGSRRQDGREKMGSQEERKRTWGQEGRSGKETGRTRHTVTVQQTQRNGMTGRTLWHGRVRDWKTGKTRSNGETGMKTRDGKTEERERTGEKGWTRSKGKIQRTREEERNVVRRQKE